MKNILLTNDDGLGASGIKALQEVFKEEKDFRLFIIAPDRQRSATSHSINFFHPVLLKRRYKDVYAIDGSPADCVKIARGFLSEKIDLVISGINHGPNMGTDVFYSGTVAAAREAVINGIPGIAVSLDEWHGEPDFSYSAEVTLKIVKEIFNNKIEKNTFLNINIPNIQADQIQGIKVTKLGKRVYNERVDKRESPYGLTYFWVVCDEITYDSLNGSDLNAVNDGYISITPLALDTTDYDKLESLNKFEQLM